MKRAGRLIGRVLDRETLREAFAQTSRGKRTKRDAAAFSRYDDKSRGSDRSSVTRNTKVCNALEFGRKPRLFQRHT
jgi:hypothetical protein